MQTASILLEVPDLHMGKAVNYSAQDGVADLISNQCSR